MSDELQEEFQLFVDRHDEFAEKYSGRVIILKGNEVVADFEDVATAYWYAVENELLGTVLIQPVGNDDSDHILTIHSQLVFV